MEKIKYLPIKMIQKRAETDQAYTEAGGGSLPDWVSKVNVDERSSMLVKTFEQLETFFTQNEEMERNIPATIELTLDAKATAKSYRSNIRKLVDVNKKNNVIGLKNDDTLIVKVDDRKDLKDIISNFKSIRKHKDGMATLIDSNEYKPEINVSNKEVLKVKLINYKDHDINDLVEKQFESTCKELALDVESIQYSNEVKVYKINYNEESFAVLQAFEALSSIEDMPMLNFSFDSLEDDDYESLEIKFPDNETEYPIVGVLDSGIARNPYLDPWISGSYSSYVDSDKNEQHGSAVASVIVYGDELSDKEIVNKKSVKLFDACIVPKKDLINQVSESDLVYNITNAIKNRKDIKIWNLSIGWEKEIDTNKISDFGAALDYLCDKYNIIICTSVGNCENFRANSAVGKIQISADSVRSLSIGSLAHVKNHFDLADVNHPSPFSRKGPGPFNLIKPELTHYGGNAGLDDRRRLTKSGVKAINKEGKIIETIGTSFSTPRICGLLAALYSEIQDYDSLLLKALLIHSAKYPDIDIDDENRMSKMGFGMPSSVNEILYNSENEITLIVRDVIEKGSYIEILDFPFPRSMVNDGYYYGEITVTLVSNPDLDVDQGEEYCQSNIDVYFGTTDDIVERKGKTVRNDIGKDTNSSKNVLAPELYSKTKMRESKGFRPERILKSYHQKFLPIKKWVVNLEEMTKGNKEKYLEYPKIWYLKIEGLFRDHIEKITDQLNNEFCLIITIKDTKSDNNIYKEIEQELVAKNFMQNDINLRTNVRLSS
ncbi:MAG: S8 family peptidase [Saprospiraceae bacterium]